MKRYRLIKTAADRFKDDLSGNKRLFGPDVDYEEIERRIHNGEHDLIGRLLNNADDKFRKHGGGYLTIGNNKSNEILYIDKLHNKVFNEGKAGLHRTYVQKVKEAIAYHQLANDLAFNDAKNIKQIYGDFDLSKNYKYHPLENIVNDYVKGGKNMHGHAYRAITQDPDYINNINRMKKENSTDFSWFKPKYVDENKLPIHEAKEAEFNLFKYTKKNNKKENTSNIKQGEQTMNNRILNSNEVSKVDQFLFNNHPEVYYNFHKKLDEEITEAAGTDEPNALKSFIATPKGVEIYNKHYANLLNTHSDKLKPVLGEEHPAFDKAGFISVPNKSAFEKLMEHKGKIGAGVGLTGLGAYAYLRSKDNSKDRK